nr:hypothetical protein [Nanoarchaeum sp.]
MFYKKYLKKLQKHTDVDNVYIFESGFWLILNKVFAIFFGILISVAFARLATKEVYGTYQFFLSVLGLLAIFALPGLNVALSQSVAKGYNYSFVHSFKTKLRWSFIGSGLLLLFSLYLKFYRDSDIWSYFIFGAIAFPLLQIAELINEYYIGKKNFKKMFFYNIFITVFSTVLIVFALYFKLNLLIIILIYLFSFSVLPLIYYFKVKSRIKDKRKDPDLIKYGKNLTLIKAMKLFLENIDKILVTYFLGFAAGAVYSVALSIPGGLRSILNLANPMIMPKATMANEEVMFKKLKSKMIWLFILPLLIIGLFWFLNPYIMNWFFSHKYDDAIFFSQLMLFSLLFTLFDAVVSTIILAKKMRKELYISNWLHFAVRLLTLIVLIPLFGIVGAIISRIVSLLFLCIYYVIIVSNYRRLKN